MSTLCTNFCWLRNLQGEKKSANQISIAKLNLRGLIIFSKILGSNKYISDDFQSSRSNAESNVSSSEKSFDKNIENSC